MRRFERLAEINGVTIVDDYAHHPAEIAGNVENRQGNDLQAGMGGTPAVHLFENCNAARRVRESASIADRVVLTEIMGSREKNTYNIYSRDLAAKIDGCVWYTGMEEVAQYVAANVQPGDLVITLGCGDIYKAADRIIEILRDK